MFATAKITSSLPLPPLDSPPCVVNDLATLFLEQKGYCVTFYTSQAETPNGEPDPEDYFILDVSYLHLKSAPPVPKRGFSFLIQLLIYIQSIRVYIARNIHTSPQAMTEKPPFRPRSMRQVSWYPGGHDNTSTTCIQQEGEWTSHRYALCSNCMMTSSPTRLTERCSRGCFAPCYALFTRASSELRASDL